QRYALAPSSRLARALPERGGDFTFAHAVPRRECLSRRASRIPGGSPMRIARRAVVAALAISAIVTSVAAANPENIAPGTFEFTPTLAFNRTSFTVPGATNTASVTHFDLSGTAGYAVNERFEVLGGLLAQHHAGA